MTTVRLDTSLAAEALLSYLRRHPDVAAERVAPNVVRLSLLGSYRAEAMELELVLRVRAWQEARRAEGVDVVVELDRAHDA